MKKSFFLTMPKTKQEILDFENYLDAEFRSIIPITIKNLHF